MSYSYDTYGRFSAVSSSVFSAFSVVNYSYLPASDLLSGYSESASGLQVTRTYEDHRNLLTQINNSVDSTTLSEYNYANDAGGRRTSVKHSGTAFDVGPAFNAYGYNARSEVTNAARYWGADLGDTSEPVDGQAYGYAYDNIGNRKVSNRGANAMTYTANGLNQYTQRTIPDGIDVLGSAETNTTVTVNNLATTRFAKYWFRALTVTNTSVPVYQPINIVGVYNPPGTNDPDVVTTASGHAFVAKTPEAFTYDDDGNLLSDGRFNYSWDAENRLIAAETSSNLVGTAVPAVRLEFAYDYMSRRAAKTVYSGLTNNYYQITNNAAFLYDGWNLISEICNLPSEITTNRYVHGVDVSGSLSGAGGIGGLLAATIGTNSVCYTYDGNGNVSELIDAQSGAISAHYEYSAFGETIVATGPLAFVNPFRFSTKFTDDEIAMLYYGYRYYSPSLGRWPSRDPIGELGGLCLYAFLGNSPVSRLDILGLTDYSGWGDYINIFILVNGGTVSSGPLASFNSSTDSIVFNNSSGQSTTEIFFLAGLVSVGLQNNGCAEAAQHFSYWVKPQGTKPNLQASFFQNNLYDHVQNVKSEAGKDCNAGSGRLEFQTDGKSDCIFLLLGDYAIDYTKTSLGNNQVQVTFTVNDKYDFTGGATANKKINGINIVIPDSVWLDLHARDNGQGIYAVDFDRSCSWQETVPCCPGPSSNASGGGGRR